MDDNTDDESGASGPPPADDGPPPDPGGGQPDGDDAGTLTGTVVLNGLADVVDEERAVLADEETRRILDDAYRSVTTPADRSACERALESARDGSEDAAGGPDGASADEQTLTDAVLATVEELEARDASLTVDHEVPLGLDERPVRVHRFFATRDGAVLAPLADDDRVADAFERGAAAARDGEMAAAAAAFEEGIEAGGDAGVGVAARVLAAWASHRAGDDEAALERVREALRRDADAWDARLVGVAADHSSPEWFREGRLASEAYLRVRTAIPDGATVEAGVVDDADGSVDWLDGDPSGYLVPRLPLAGRLRLRFRGPPDGLPSLHAYYLAVGVVEPESMRPRTVEDTLLDGPLTASASERLRIRLP